MIERVLQRSTGSISSPILWGSGDLPPTLPDTATVTITRSDGALVAEAVDAAPLGNGVFTYPLTPTDTAVLDTFTVDWFNPTVGTTRTYVEVVGDFLFTIAQARAALGSATYDVQKITDARTYAETELEGALGYALVPRYSRATISGDRREPVRLRPFVTAIRSVTVDGYALDASQLSQLTVTGESLRGYYWTTGFNNITVGYEHGLTPTPPGAQQAALALALDVLDGGPAGNIDPRAESIVTVDGTVRLRMGTGQFSAAGVNEWIEANALPAIA